MSHHNHCCEKDRCGFDPCCDNRCCPFPFFPRLFGGNFIIIIIAIIILFCFCGKRDC